MYRFCNCWWWSSKQRALDGGLKPVLTDLYCCQVVDFIFRPLILLFLLLFFLITIHANHVNMINCSRMVKIRNMHCLNSGRVFKPLRCFNSSARFSNVVPISAAAALPLVMTFGRINVQSYCEAPAAQTVPKAHIQPVDESQPVSRIQQLKKCVVDLWNKICRLFMASKRIVVCGTVISSALLLTPVAINLNYKEFLWTYYLSSIQYLGPTFIKLAQWASTRPDLFP